MCAAALASFLGRSVPLPLTGALFDPRRVTTMKIDTASLVAKTTTFDGKERSIFYLTDDPASVDEANGAPWYALKNGARVFPMSASHLVYGTDSPLCAARKASTTLVDGELEELDAENGAQEDFASMMGEEPELTAGFPESPDPDAPENRTQKKKRRRKRRTGSAEPGAEKPSTSASKPAAKSNQQAGKPKPKVVEVKMMVERVVTKANQAQQRRAVQAERSQRQQITQRKTQSQPQPQRRVAVVVAKEMKKTTKQLPPVAAQQLSSFSPPQRGEIVRAIRSETNRIVAASYARASELALRNV